MIFHLCRYQILPIDNLQYALFDESGHPITSPPNIQELVERKNEILAINITTIGLIITKVGDLQSDKADFRGSIRSMKISIWIQVGLIALAVAVSVVDESATAQALIPSLELVSSVILGAVFFAVLWILVDTANAPFILVDK